MFWQGGFLAVKLPLPDVVNFLTRWLLSCQAASTWRCECSDKVASQLSSCLYLTLWMFWEGGLPAVDVAGQNLLTLLYPSECKKSIKFVICDVLVYIIKTSVYFLWKYWKNMIIAIGFTVSTSILWLLGCSLPSRNQNKRKIFSHSKLITSKELSKHRNRSYKLGKK
jgi:hypothetical protein